LPVTYHELPIYLIRPNSIAILTSVCTGWAKLNDARYHSRQFPPGPWVSILRHGRVQTLVDPFIRPNFGRIYSVTDVSAMYPDILLQPIKRQSDLFSGPYGGLTLHVVYFYLLTELHSSQKTAMTSCSLLASSTNLHSLCSADWLLIPR